MRNLTVKFSYEGKKYCLKAKLKDNLELPLVKANSNVCDEDYDDMWQLSWIIIEDSNDFSKSISAVAEFRMIEGMRTEKNSFPVVKIWGECLLDEIQASITWK